VKQRILKLPPRSRYSSGFRRGEIASNALIVKLPRRDNAMSKPRVSDKKVSKSGSGIDREPSEGSSGSGPASVDHGAIEAWSTRQSYQKADEKQLMGAYFAAHDFLVSEAADSETAPRQTVASIVANNGTTGNTVGLEVLEWALAQRDSFDLTWFTTGSVLPATLRKFKLDHPRLAAATQLFLFPGRVDPNLEAISGPEATEFVKNYKGRFTYAILGAYGFDIKRGEVYFHYSSELELQNACAGLRAAHKFLFLDSRKFEVEGRVGYTVDQLLSTSASVTIYTVSSPRAMWVYENFKSLCVRLLDPPNPEDPYAEDTKVLRLRVVGRGSGAPLCHEHSGILKSSKEKAALPLRLGV
jgi:hypothetical protein